MLMIVMHSYIFVLFEQPLEVRHFALLIIVIYKAQSNDCHLPYANNMKNSLSIVKHVLFICEIIRLISVPCLRCPLKISMVITVLMHIHCIATDISAHFRRQNKYCDWKWHNFHDMRLENVICIHTIFYEFYWIKRKTPFLILNRMSIVWFMRPKCKFELSKKKKQFQAIYSPYARRQFWNSACLHFVKS